MHEINDKTATWKEVKLKYCPRVLKNTTLSKTWDMGQVLPQWYCLLGLYWRKFALKMLVYIYVALQKWQNQVAKWHYDIQKKCQCDRCK